MTTRATSWPTRPDPPTLRLRDPAGVVAAVPYLLGFVPSRSLVVVGVDDDQGVGATLRADLPTPDLLRDPPQALHLLWQHAVQVLRRNGCSRALVVLYGDVEPAALPAEAARRLVAVLSPRTGAPEGSEEAPHDPAAPDDPTAPDDPAAPDVLDVLDVLDVMHVGPTRFRSLLCTDRSCCPAEGAPVATTGSHPVAASFVLAGRRAARGRDDVEPVPPPADPAESGAAADAVGRARDGRPTGRAGHPHDHALLEEWLRCLPQGPPPELAGRLAAGWRSNPMLRDACLAAFLPGGPALARSVLSPALCPAPGSLASSLADPRCAGAVHDGAPVLRRMAALVPAPERADVLAAHAWLSWSSGEGTAAAVLAERSLEMDRGQSLARLVLQCLDHGLGAPWTLRPPAPGRRTSRPGGISTSPTVSWGAW